MAADDDTKLWYLYHLRDPEASSGFGFDGYIGITRNPARRKEQHLSALTLGRHRNSKLQSHHDASTAGLQFSVVFAGTREQVLARERLLVPKADHHLNSQVGGGPLRGLTYEEAMSTALPPSRGSSEASSAEARRSPQSHTGPGSVGGGVGSAGAATASSAGRGAAGMRSALTGAGGAAAAVGAGLMTVGLGSAYVMNRTVLKNEEDLSDQERSSRRIGRVASYAGGALGAVGTLTGIGASGTVVGLSSSGIVAGVTAIGASLGGGAILGTVVVAALPVAGACGLGYGVYRFSKWLRPSERH